MRARSLRWRSARRRPWVFWIVATMIAVSSALCVTAMVEESERRIDAWGPGRSVPVATHDLAPGSAVSDGDVRWEVRPNAVVAPGVIEPGSAVVGRVVITRVFAGEPLVRGRLAPDGVEGLAALLPPGTVAVVVPAAAHPPKLRVGDTVDLYAGTSRGAPITDEGDAVARSATVVETADDGAVTVAIPRADAARVAPAILDGAVIVALVAR